MSNARYLVVPGVTIRHQIAGKALKEVRGPFSAAVRLVLKDSDGLFTFFSAAAMTNLLQKRLYRRLIIP